MRNCLFLVALLVVSQLNNLKAQSLFSAPDTVCVRQPIQLSDSVNAASYYWGFCSAYLVQNAVGENYGVDSTNFKLPGDIIIAKQGAYYYGFVTNTATGTLLRLDFGTSLNDTPKVVQIGDINGTVPDYATDMTMFQDDNGDWFLFVVGGIDSASSTLARFDFGADLENTRPAAVNFGNLYGHFNSPRGIIVQKESDNYYGYVANHGDNRLLRLEFGTNISYTPYPADLGAGFGLSQPTDIISVLENGNWHLFIVNELSSELVRMDLGTSFAGTPTPNNLGNMMNRIFGPTAISFIRDCGGSYFYIANGVSSDVTKVQVGDLINGPYTPTLLPAIADLNVPTGLTQIIRDRDDIFMFLVNAGDSSLSVIKYPQCTNSSIASSTNKVPPVYSYSRPGTYNVYLAVNEGRPDMMVECKQIVVLPIPPMAFHNDTTICQGDTVTVFVQAAGPLSYTWYPNYNISDTSAMTVRVWPEYTVDYHLVLPYSNGCIVDTPITVEVIKNRADAGPDRMLHDGAKTMIGGPLTSISPQLGDPSYTYTWLPNQFILSEDGPNAVVSPPYDFTYYLEVRNSFGCYDIDTVVVRVTCNDLNLPNAFAPESGTGNVNHFGIMNRQVVKLNYFRIFDRWGRMVFESDDVTRRWDGTVNGEPAPFGVYVWEADGFCYEGQRFRQSGNVTLVR